tara:strand:- start:3304 stop:3489 length:186 start_codon:yes stop_codon:yes gene_type:complete
MNTMNLEKLLNDGWTIELGHKFTIEKRGIGFDLLCGGNFVFFNTSLDEVLERYTRQTVNTY